MFEALEAVLVFSILLASDEQRLLEMIQREKVCFCLSNKKPEALTDFL